MALAMQHLFQQVANAASRATYGITCAHSRYVTAQRHGRLLLVGRTFLVLSTPRTKQLGPGCLRHHCLHVAHNLTARQTCSPVSLPPPVSFTLRLADQSTRRA